MKLSLIPFTPEQLCQEFDPITVAVVDINQMRTKYAADYEATAGETPQEKHLSAITDRIESLAVKIESHKLAIGFLISMGNLMGLPQAVGFSSMEEYMISDNRKISSTLIHESKRYYQAWLLVKDRGYNQEQIGAASAAQVDAVTSTVTKVEKQRNEILDKRAQNIGASEFRRLSAKEKEEISKDVEEELQDEIKKEVDFILNSPPETAHQILAASSIKPDRPRILCSNFHLDPSTGKMSWQAECWIEETQISAFRKNNVSCEYILADDPGHRLNQEALADWIKDALA